MNEIRWWPWNRLFVELFPAEKSLQSYTCYWIGICKTKNDVTGIEKSRGNKNAGFFGGNEKGCGEGGVEVVICIGQQLCEINFL